MIAIMNRGPITDDHGGERTYEIKINEQTITTFKHYRKDGLAVCLEKAAKSVKKSDVQHLLNILEMK